MKEPSDLSVPEYPDDPKRQAAYTRFVVNGESANYVLSNSKIPVDTFARWRRDGAWDEKRADILMTERKAAAYEVGVMAAKSAREIFHRYGDLQNKLLDTIEKKLGNLRSEPLLGDDGSVLESSSSTLDILRLTQAVTACHGIGKHMLGAAGVEDAEAEGGKPPVMVQVNVLNAIQDTLDELP